MVWHSSIVTIKPDAEPVTLAQAKTQFRIDRNDEDLFIGDLIKRARSHIERRCNVVFAEQTIQSSCSSFADFSRLPRGPVKSVEAITYTDINGNMAVLDSAIYTVLRDGLEPSIVLKSGQTWPNIQPGSRIVVTAVYGGDAPDDICHAILLLAGAWYENREATVIGVSVDSLPVSVGLDALICNHCRGA